MPTRPSIPFLLDLLRLAMRREATALYVVPWMPPTLRIGARQVPLSSTAFTPEQSTLLVLDLLDDERRAALDRSREIEFDLTLDDLGRFRVHAFRRHGQPAMAVRPFALDVPLPATLALPAAACQAVRAGHGLLVVASSSAALRRDAAAALLEDRNRHHEGELALLDGASRFWHEPARCRVRQGLDAAALDDLLRRRTLEPLLPPPLAIAWGELRDGPQLERVVRAAEQALCVVTLAAAGLPAALQRLIGLAAEHTGPPLLHRTAIQLHGVLALRPVPARDAGHDLAATQLLMNTPELAACLSEGDFDALRRLLEAGAAGGAGSRSGKAALAGADTHLAQLLAEGRISPEVALRHALDPEALMRRLRAGELPPPPAPAAAVAVDTGFADLFDTGAMPADPFAFAERPLAPPPADTQFDDVDWSAGATPSQPLSLDPRPLVGAPPSPHAARFHVWATPAVAAGAVATVDVWVGRADEADRVAERAAGGAEPEPEAAIVAPGETPLLLQLRIDGMLPAPGTQRCLWTGGLQRVRFAVPVPRQAAAGAHAARVRLQLGGLSIGELSFVLPVRPDAPGDTAPADAHAVRRMVPSAYAAFVPEDRDGVEHCLEPLRRVAPDLEVFLGAPGLRSAEGWRARIEQALARCERLFLFWSRAAAESPWVDFEWRQVLRRRGPGAIDIVLIDPPRLAPLPPELADLPVTMTKRTAAPGA